MKKVTVVVIKRDGRQVAFDQSKLFGVIKQACDATELFLEKEVIDRLVDQIVQKVISLGLAKLQVEQIQDIVVNVLKQNGHHELAQKYDAYRQTRNAIREQNMKIIQVISKIAIETDRDNANVGNNFSAKLLRIASETNKWYMLLKLLPKNIAKHHENGDYYIHDLDSYNLTINCLHLPTKKLLQNGFDTGYGMIRPPQSIEAAAALICIALQASQNDMFGGQSHPNFDNDLAEYVDKTRQKVIGLWKTITSQTVNMTMVEQIVEKSVHQAMQSVVYNLNSMHSRAGSQVPFSSLNIGIPQSKDAALVCQVFLEEYEKGLGYGEQPIFPNIIFRIKDGINKKPSDPYYYLFQLACRVASYRMNPTFMNLDADFNLKYYEQGYLPATMGCRTYLMSNVNGEPGVEGRGNNAPVTMNIVRLAFLAKRDLNVFFKSLDNLLEECMQQILHRYETLKQLKVKDLPFVAGQHLMRGSENLKPNDSIESIMRNGTWGIGFIGLAETLILLTGKHHGESPEAQELGLKIVSTIRNKCDEYTKKYKMNISCYATPAEGLSGKFTVIDKKKFGDVDWIISKGFYTNSFHVPVDYHISFAKKLEIEAPYHRLCNGGHISYVEFDNYPTQQDVERLVLYAYNKTCINYIGVNFHIRYCLDCHGE